MILFSNGPVFTRPNKFGPVKNGVAGRNIFRQTNFPNPYERNGGNPMKKLIVMIFLSLVWSATALAAGTRYQMRVDGLACPYCAYGIEKKLNAIDGVEKIDVDLNKGLVTVNTADDVKLSEEQMIKLFKDAGFTYRSMTEKAL